MKPKPFFVAFLMLAAVCAEAGDIPPKTSPDLIKANTGFALKLLREVAADAPTSNVVVSPVGLSVSFALLSNAASETARQQISRTFNFGGMPTAELNRNARLLMHDLTVSSWKDDDSGEVRDYKKGFRLSSSLWLKPSESFRPGFLSTNKSFYSFGLKVLPQQPRQAAAALNRFISADTKGQVPSVAILPNRDDFVLLTTTHFGCTFPHPFSDGGKADFTLNSRRKKSVRMITNMYWYPYVRGDHFQGASVDCGGTSDLWMFLPDEDYSVEQLASELTVTSWDEWTRHSAKGKAFILTFPSFKIEHKQDVLPVLSRLGTSEVFEHSSSLAHVVTNPQGAKLTRILQTVFVEVNEREIRAGSVDYVGGVAGGVMGGSPPPKLVLDRPFLFAITDRDTGTILFMGVLRDPSESGT